MSILLYLQNMLGQFNSKKRYILFWNYKLFIGETKIYWNYNITQAHINYTCNKWKENETKKLKIKYSQPKLKQNNKSYQMQINAYLPMIFNSQRRYKLCNNTAIQTPTNHQSVKHGNTWIQKRIIGIVPKYQI